MPNFNIKDWDHDELTTVFQMSSTVFASIGLSVTVTTQLATDEVWLFASVPTSAISSGSSPYMKYLRDNVTDVLVGAAAGNRIRSLACGSNTNVGNTSVTAGTLLAVDSPGGVGAYTYQIYIRVGDVVSAVYVNRGDADVNVNTDARCAVQMTAYVMPLPV